MEGNTYVRESYLFRIRPFVGKGVAKVITGMRRGGKSTIMYLMVSELMSDGVSGERILKYDLESRNTPRFKDADELYGRTRTIIYCPHVQSVDNVNSVYIVHIQLYTHSAYTTM